MLRFVKTFACLAALFMGFQSAFGFSLLGPINEPYQQGGNPNQIDYNFPGDIGAPKNLGEEYRWNTPTLYYACDQSFLDYFGSNGLHAIDQAMAILNSLTNVSSYSSDLSEFPLESSRVNFKAQSLNLVDIKSETMSLMIEELGLAEPDRYTWTLHNRFLIPGASCPFYLYTVIKRNFDPVTDEPSSYVNGTLYTYGIDEFCPIPDRADASEIRVDPTAPGFTAVASLGNIISFLDGAELDEGFQRFGFFYTGLTRDDVGGLRYLYATNNMNVETAETNSLAFVTNPIPQLLVSSNLSLFALQALTNNAAALQALYPGLIITATSNFFSVGFTTNITAILVPAPPWAPAGTFTIGLVTNVTPTFVTSFVHTFANIVTFQFINGQWVAIPLTSLSAANGLQITALQNNSVVITAPPFSPPGFFQITTNTTTTLNVQPGPVGEFFILPPNVCDVKILSAVFTNVIPVTNILASATNTTFATNFLGQALSTELDLVSFFTNHTFVVELVNCVADAPSLRQGVEKITYVRRDFDSLLGQFFSPITNIYSLNEVTNNQIVRRWFSRVVQQPDILFSAQDLGNGPGGPISLVYASRTAYVAPHANAANALPGLAGPGTLTPPINIVFNKFGPIFLNTGPNFIDEATGTFDFQWGSFDGTTNDPVVYPSGNSIRNLENQVLMQVTTSSSINVGPNFSIQLTGTGGQPSYTWALTPGSPGLPPGVTLSSDGILSGTAATPGSYQIVVRMSDAGARFVDKVLTIVISP